MKGVNAAIQLVCAIMRVAFEIQTTDHAILNTVASATPGLPFLQVLAAKM